MSPDIARYSSNARQIAGESLCEQEATWKDCKSRYCNDAKMEKEASNQGVLFGDLGYWYPISLGSIEWNAFCRMKASKRLHSIFADGFDPKEEGVKRRW